MSDDKDFTTSEQLDHKLNHALSPTELGRAFDSAARESKSIDTAIRSILIQLIKSDADVAESIKFSINKHNNDQIKILAGKLFTLVIAIISAFVGAAIKSWFDK